MQLKTFSAPSLQQALQKAKLDLGEEGMIVSTSFDSQLGIACVVAGIEQPLWIEKTIQHHKKDILADIEACLAFHDVAEGYFLQLMTIAGSNLHLKNPVDILGKSLESSLCFQQQEETPQVIALVGLSGAGKTSVTARLAMSSKANNQDITIVSLDHFKAGAYEQVSCYSNAIQVNLELPQSPQELKSVIKETSGKIIIDTPGINPFDKEDQLFLKEWIHDYPKMWVNPVNTDIEEAKEYSKFFHEIGANQHLITKTDLCKKLGSTLSFLLQEETHVSYWSHNPRIGIPLQEGTSYNFAELLMQKYIQANRTGGNNDYNK